MFTHVYYCLLMFAIPIYKSCSLQRGTEAFAPDLAPVWALSAVIFQFFHLWRRLGFVHQYLRQASRFQHVSTIHVDFSCESMPFHCFSYQEFKALTPSRILSRHHGVQHLSDILAICWPVSLLRFEPPSREEVHSTCGAHTFESRTCSGWKMVRILKYLENQPLRLISELHDTASRLESFQSALSMCSVYLHLCGTSRTLQVPSWSVFYRVPWQMTVRLVRV